MQALFFIGYAVKSKFSYDSYSGKKKSEMSKANISPKSFSKSMNILK